MDMDATTTNRKTKNSQRKRKRKRRRKQEEATAHRKNNTSETRLYKKKTPSPSLAATLYVLYRRDAQASQPETRKPASGERETKQPRKENANAGDKTAKRVAYHIEPHHSDRFFPLVRKARVLLPLLLQDATEELSPVEPLPSPDNHLT